MTITLPTMLEVLHANGQMEGHAVNSAWQYESPNGAIQFAIFIGSSYCDIYQSPYVLKPVCLFELGELTEEGQQLSERTTIVRS